MGYAYRARPPSRSDPYPFNIAGSAGDPRGCTRHPLSTSAPRLPQLVMTLTSRVQIKPFGILTLTSAGLPLNQHDAPWNLLEMVVRNSGGQPPAAPGPHHVIIRTPGRSRKYVLVAYDTLQSYWFLGIPVGSLLGRHHYLGPGTLVSGYAQDVRTPFLA